MTVDEHGTATESQGGAPPQPRVVEVVSRESGEVMRLVYAIPPELLQGAEMDDGVSLGELALRVWRQRLLVLVIVTLFAVGSVFHALAQPNVYTATVTALPPPEKGSNLGQYAAMAAMAGINMSSGGSTSTDAILAILNSRRLHEQLIAAHGLAEHYGNPESRDRLLRSFRSNWSASAARTGATISFGYTSEDPTLAATVANHAAEVLHELFTDLQHSEAARERAFYERRLEQAERESTEALEALVVFQRRHKTIEIESQAAATVSTIGSLQGQLISQQIELRALRTVAVGDDNPQLRLHMERIRGLEDEITRLQGSGVEGALIGLQDLPELGQEYLRLLREVKRQEALVNGLVAQVEAARLSEAREAAVVTIVDPASVPDLKSGPRRALICIAATMLGGMLALVLALLREPLAAWRAQLAKDEG